MKESAENPVCLTIAGVDPSGGAGVIADLKTFAAFGCYGAAAITSLTFQNTLGVFGAANQSAEIVRRQIEPVLEDLPVVAIKTGMLPSEEIITEIADIIASRKVPFFVLDPVVRSTSGFDLIDDLSLRALIEKLFPLSDLITPNLAEAERIAGFPIQNADDMRRAADEMHCSGAKNVLIKGGHFPSGSSPSVARKAVDRLFAVGEMIEFESAFIDTTSTHGTGCTLAAAIAANLALGNEMKDSIRRSKNFVTKAIATAPRIGRGNGPVNHFAPAE